MKNDFATSDVQARNAETGADVQWTEARPRPSLNDATAEGDKSGSATMKIRICDHGSTGAKQRALRCELETWRNRASATHHVSKPDFCARGTKTYLVS